ncbi:alkaline phosphatase family protein [Lacticaseibacillus daqingensis]|uniref:alkaline phosphatase family protein n=1 Tax=Lacticaseibacillus daqingensis TaxID=2486014 RepID=UPI000F76CF3A|nr:alkaline phosphatase family protein [Lacticaseibacillus daqingensis]
MRSKIEVYKDSYSAGTQYLAAVDSYHFWQNSLKTSLPQTVVSDQVMNFLATPGEKNKKVAVIGYDGARADLLVNLLASHPNEDPYDQSGFVSGHFPDSVCSGIRTLLADSAELYISYAGGLKGTPSEQHTSTAPGWASITTGKWSNDHGMNDNGVSKNINVKTFMLRAAEKYGSKSLFTASWPDHFHVNYVDEISYLEENPDIPMKYIECSDDLDTYNTMKQALTEGSDMERDIVFCTLEGADSNGHITGFGNKNYRYTNGFRDVDEIAYQLLQTIYNRPSYKKEDWLIILTTDHGGLGNWHGFQSSEERTTWLVTNRSLPETSFSKNYNGYSEEAAL